MSYPPRVRVLILGDSNAVAMGPLLAERLTAAGHEVHQLAKHGRGASWWTRRGWWRVKRTVQQLEPDALIAIFGAKNDSADRRFETAVRKLGGALPRGRVIWIGSPSYRRDRLQRRADRLLKMVRSVMGDRLIDSHPHTDPRDVPRTPDGIHVTKGGARRWADSIAPEVEAALEAD